VSEITQQANAATREPAKIPLVIKTHG